jgi:hypothetical protein
MALGRRLPGLARLLRPAGPGRTPGARPEPYLTLIDAGGGAIKVLVLDLDSTPVAVIGGAAEAAPPAGAAGTAGGAFPEYLAAAERALVTAEDAAGVVPRRAALLAGGAIPATARGLATVRRRRPHLPLAREEVARAVDRALASATAAAEREGAAALLRPVPLATIQVALRALRLDGEPVPAGRLESPPPAPSHPASRLESPPPAPSLPADDAPGRTGETLDVEVELGLAPEPEVERLHRLADALDLDVAGLVSLPLALGAVGSRRPGGAIVVDAGARLTTAAVAGPGGSLGAVTVPLGCADLEAQLAKELGVAPEVARELLRAHAGGSGGWPGGGDSSLAGRRGAGGGDSSRLAGPGAWRVVRRLAALHAEVWADALELALAGLAEGHALPPTVLLCGGAVALPEVRRALGGAGWGRSLPFPRPPAPTLLGRAEVVGVDDRAMALPVLEAPPVLAGAAIAARLFGRAT